MPTQEISATAFVNRYRATTPTEMTVMLSAKNNAVPMANMGSATTLTGADIPEESEGNLYLNSIQQVKGTINNTKNIDNTDAGETGLHSFEVYGATRDLRQNTHTRTYNEALITDVLKDVFNASAAGEINLSEVEQSEIAVSDDINNREYLVSESFTNVPCLSILQRLCRSVDWYWYVDYDNTVQVIDSFEYEYATNYGHERFNIDIDLTPPTGRTFLIHELEYVMEASAGKLTPPYQRVVVTGSMSGDVPPERQHLQSKNPIRGVAKSESYSPGDPTFTYRDELLTTQSNADKAAKAILAQLESQQTGGWVEVVGHPLIRPNDAIQMPDHMGGAQYMVADVEHTVDSQNGFTTRIGCNGLLTTPGDREVPTPFDAGTVAELQEDIHNVPVTQR